MKRLKIALALIALLLSIGIGSVLYTYHTTRELSCLLEEIRTSALQESCEETAGLCREYNEVWIQKEKILVKLLRHHPIDAVTGLSAQLETFAKYGETLLLLSTLDQLDESMHHIWEEECPSLYNIL